MMLEVKQMADNVAEVRSGVVFVCAVRGTHGEDYLTCERRFGVVREM